MTTTTTEGANSGSVPLFASLEEEEVEETSRGWVSMHYICRYKGDDCRECIVAMLNLPAGAPNKTGLCVGQDGMSLEVEIKPPFLAKAENTFRVLRKYCLLYTSPSPRDQRGSRMPSSA